MTSKKEHPDLFSRLLPARPGRSRPKGGRRWDWTPIAWGAGFAGVGVILGITIGLYLAQPERPRTEPDVLAPEEVVAPTDRSTAYDDDIEYDVPVRIDRSERALKRYQYEEHPPQIRPGESQVRDDPIDELVATLNDQEPLEDSATISVERQPGTPPAFELGPDASEQEWQRQAITAPGLTDETRPLIAIVIDDVGIDQRRTRHSIELPPPLTLAFIPYGYNLRKLVGMAHENGHEVMLHMPMEPSNPKVDPGPNALLTSLEEEELLRRIHWGMKQFEGYVGVNNHMGSKFTASEPVMRLVMAEVKKKGLLFMDSITSPNSVAFRIARELDVPTTRRDVFLDNVLSEEEIEGQLRLTERIARDQGHAIAIGHPHDETLAVLERWLPGAAKRGFRLVTVSAIVERNRSLRLAQERGAAPEPAEQ